MRLVRHAWGRGMLACLACLIVFPAHADPVPAAGGVPYLEPARQVVRDLQQNALVNQYGTSPTFLRWGHPTREARTVCATFVTRLFEHAYGWDAGDIRRWLGAGGADASEWYQAIADGNGFRRLTRVDDLRPGDIVAIEYHDGSADTGHVMVIDAAPERRDASPPLERGTAQYRVEVIDSSASGHGPADTRHKPDGGFTGGIGEGAIRLYADRDGRIAGYAWSETPQSKFYQSPARALVVGRLTRGNGPAPAP